MTNQLKDRRNYTDSMEQAGRTRIQHFYQDKKGKNTAESFTITREHKSKRHLNLIRTEEEEITERQEILNRLRTTLTQ
jgi:hypothetical protein